jgi:SAM-dependent methyltransferase
MKIMEGIRVKDIKVCMLCGSFGFPFYRDLGDRLLGVPGKWGFLCCPKCGLVWLNPQPIPEDIEKLYEGYFYTGTSPNRWSLKLTLLPRVVKRGILGVAFGYENQMTKRREWLIGRLLSWSTALREAVGGQVMWLEARRRGRILDVGCGTGQFLAQMRDLGWEVMGVEPNPEAARIAEEQYGVKVCQVAFDKAPLPENYFDAITMNHVIEHVSDPVDVLRKCFRLLRPGGIMVVVTPHIESIGHKLLKKFWLCLDPPRHFYLFSLRTLRTCSELAILRIDEIRTTARLARTVWPISRFIRRAGALPLNFQQSLSPLYAWWLRLEGIFFYAFESLLPKMLHLGEEIVMIASKNKNE